MKIWKRIAMGITAAFILGIGSISGQQAIANAAPANTASIGVVDYLQVKRESADFKQAQAEVQAEQAKLQKEYEEKSAALTDAEKRQLYTQYSQRLDAMVRELDGKIDTKINEAIKNVASAQGISIVLDKSVVFYGGKDLTQDVVNKIK